MSRKRKAGKVTLSQKTIHELRSELERLLRSEDIHVVRRAARMYRRYPELLRAGRVEKGGSA